MQIVTKREPFDISVIKEIEKQFKIKIPEVLKKYYLKYGNSHIKTCEFNVDGLLTDVSEIVSINKNDSSSFYQVMDYRRSDRWIHDFFCSFTPIEMDAEIKQMIDETRQAVAKRYDFDLLYQWTLTTGAKSTVRRRFNTQALKENAYEKFAQWEKGPIPNLVNIVNDRGTSI